MKTSIGIIAFLALGTPWVSAQTVPPMVAKSASFSLKVSTTNELFHLGKASSLEISLTNISDRKIYVRRTNGNVGAADFDVFAQDENGKNAPKSSFNQELKGGPPKDSSGPKVEVRGGKLSSHSRRSRSIHREFDRFEQGIRSQSHWELQGVGREN